MALRNEAFGLLIPDNVYFVDKSMQLTAELATDYSIQENRRKDWIIMRCRKWQELEPWRPFFWASRLPTGIYLRAPHKPVLLPSSYEVDQEVYFAIRLVPMIETMALRIQRYAFLKNPGAHTQRSVKREGYWHFGGAIATSAHKSCKVLRNFMNFLEELVFYNIALSKHEDRCLFNDKRFSNSTLSKLVAWEERLE